MASSCIDPGDTAWVLLSTILVLTMVPALAFFEAGMLRSKNTVSILTQVLGGLAILTCLWFVIGFSLAFGESLGGFIGSPTTYPFFFNVKTNECFDKPGAAYAPYIPAIAFAMFENMFASIAPLLLTGAFAERLRWNSFVTFIIAWEFLVYIPVCHWIWGQGGFLKNMGVLDFAGGIVLHTSAGSAAIVSALYLGRRKDFLENHGEFAPSNLPIAAVGGALLWMGWFGFNAGSAFSSGAVSASAVSATQFGSASCCAVWMILSHYHHRPNIADVLNGAIAGLAGITPASGYVTVQASVVIGLVLGVSSYYSVELLKHRLHIDDALDVSSIHGLTGVVGSISIGFAATLGENPAGADGLIYSSSPRLLGVQCLAILIVGVWSSGITFLILKVIDRVFILKISSSDDSGLDALEHDCEAYRISHHSPEHTLHKSDSTASFMDDSRMTSPLLGRALIDPITATPLHASDAPHEDALVYASMRRASAADALPDDPSSAAASAVAHLSKVISPPSSSSTALPHTASPNILLTRRQASRQNLAEKALAKREKKTREKSAASATGLVGDT